MVSIPLYNQVIRTSYALNSTKILQKIFDDDGITACNLFSKSKPNKKFFGSIPSVFLKNVQPKDKKSTVMHLRKSIAEFAKAVSACNSQIEQKLNIDLTDKEERILKKRVSVELASKLVEYLQQLLHQPIKMDVIGEGGFGRVFSLKIGDKKFAIKTFFNQDEIHTGHGGTIEPLIAQFLQKTTNSGIMAKCFLGRISPFNGKGAYIVSKFIEKTDKPRIRDYGLLTAANPIKWNDAYFEPFPSLDINHINGIVFDPGGAELKTYFPNDKETAKLIRILCQLVDASNLEGFDAFLHKHKSNSKLQAAKKYLRTDLKNNNVFATHFCSNNLNVMQKKMLHKLGLKETSAVKNIAQKQDSDYVKNLIPMFFP